MTTKQETVTVDGKVFDVLHTTDKWIQFYSSFEIGNYQPPRMSDLAVALAELMALKFPSVYKDAKIIDKDGNTINLTIIK